MRYTILDTFLNFAEYFTKEEKKVIFACVYYDIC